MKTIRAGVILGIWLSWTPSGHGQICLPGWTQESEPRHRFDHAMAYDGARGVTVLFGGEDESETYGDTWEWDGSTWTLAAGDGPAPRDHHAMVYDLKRGAVVLFGGWVGTYDGETWEFGFGEFVDCNQNGFPDACDIKEGRSRDDNHNGVPDECEPCTGHEKLSAKCQGRPGQYKIKVKLKKGASGLALTFRLDGDPDTDQIVFVNDKGKAKVKFTGDIDVGTHVLEAFGCDDPLRADAQCQ